MPPITAVALESAQGFLHRVAQVDLAQCPCCQVGRMCWVETLKGCKALPAPAAVSEITAAQHGATMTARYASPVGWGIGCGRAGHAGVVPRPATERGDLSRHTAMGWPSAMPSKQDKPSRIDVQCQIRAHSTACQTYNPL